MKVNPDYSLPSDDELYAEIQVLRGEIANIVSEVRTLIGNVRKDPETWGKLDIADALEEIVDG